MRLRRTAILAILFCFVAGCASTIIRSTRRAPDFHNAQIRRVMVVGVFKDPSLRKAFEEEFVRQWKARGVDAVSGLDVLPSTATLYKVGIAPVAKVQGFDTVLVARVLERRPMGPGEPATLHVDPESQNAAENLNSALQALLAPSGVTNSYELASVETSLYDVTAGLRFWSATSETKITRKMSEQIPSLVRLILKRIYQTA